MKEAAGEANMTVVTIVLIAIVLGVGTLIVTNLMRSVQDEAVDGSNGVYNQTSCEAAGGTWDSGTKTCNL